MLSGYQITSAHQLQASQRACAPLGCGIVVAVKLPSRMNFVTLTTLQIFKECCHVERQNF